MKTVSAILLITLLCAPNAYADIGGVGSPVVPSNLPAPAKNVPSPAPVPGKAAANTNNANIILTIDFSLHHVDFENQLRQVISQAQASNAGAQYEVISTIPTAYNKREQGNDMRGFYAANLEEVVGDMQGFGVLGSNIQVKEEASSDITAQQVSVVVK